MLHSMKAIEIKPGYIKPMLTSVQVWKELKGVFTLSHVHMYCPEHVKYQKKVILEGNVACWLYR